MRWHPTESLIYTCTLDGAVHLWDTRSGERKRQWFGHTKDILDFDLTKYVLLFQSKLFLEIHLSPPDSTRQ